MPAAPASDLTPPLACAKLLSAAVVASAITAIVLLSTSPGLPMVWDEGNAIDRAQGIAHWAGRWRQLSGDEAAKRPGPLSAEAIAADWRYTTQIEGHPAFYGIVIAVGRWLSGAWLPPLSAARFGPILLFALAAGAMFYRLAREYSLIAGVGGLAALLLQPRLFAHAHFASLDGPLTACWILAWATFAPAHAEKGARDLLCEAPEGPFRQKVPGTFFWLPWGVALGMTLSCKVTGWIAPLPFLAWALVYRDRPGLRAVTLGAPVALATFFLLNPPLWHAPLVGLAEFFRLNLSRAANPDLNITTQFLGQMYNLDFPLPWYNTLLWTAIAVPVGILALAAVGIGHVARHVRDEPAGLLLLGQWAVLLVVRALPGVPPHDGIRLFLPSFAMLAAIAGVGCHAIVRASWPSVAMPGKKCRLTAIALVLAGSASSLLWYAPQWLSYYNLAIGGLPGATALGMEPTYYWDALDRSVLQWLEAHTDGHEKICFASPSQANLVLMRQWGTLPRNYQPDAPGKFAWYVIQRRPSAWQPADRWLIENGRPAFRKTIRQSGWGPWRLDVLLLDIFPYQQYQEACRAIAGR